MKKPAKDLGQCPEDRATCREVLEKLEAIDQIIGPDYTGGTIQNVKDVVDLLEEAEDRVASLKEQLEKVKGGLDRANKYGAQADKDLERFLGIIAERKCQDAMWEGGEEHTNPIWLTILTEEVGEAAEAVLGVLFGTDDPPRDEFGQGIYLCAIETLRIELTQVAAVAVAWLEKLEEAKS